MFNCLVVRNFWFKIIAWLFDEYKLTVEIGPKDVLFGHDCEQENNVVNLIIMYAKMFIYKCKYKGTEIHFEHFLLYVNSNIPK